jgi:hypothetical protein
VTFTDDYVVELAIDSSWVDITQDVLVDQPVTVNRGAPDEYGDVPPSECNLTIKNQNGQYSPRNPIGPYYGKLGRNTPIRVARRVARDQFTRTVSSNWGPADLGGTWTIFGGVGGDYGVGSGVATHTISTTPSSRLSFLGGQTHRDISVAATVDGPTTVTGATIDYSITLGGTSTSDFHIVRARISTSQVVSMRIDHADGTQIYGNTTVTGFTWTGAPMRIRAEVDGCTIRAKAWLAGTPEPYAWVVEANVVQLDSRPVAKGWGGLRTTANTGNTNVPFTATWDDLEVRSNRFIGEVSNWPSEWDLNGEDIRTPLVASGIARRLKQGEAPQRSSYYRGNTAGIVPRHLGYWPVEDESSATSIASAIGGRPMQITGTGSPRFAANSDFVGSQAIGQPNGSVWSARIPVAPATGQLQGVFLLSVPDTGENDGAAFLQMQCTGTAGYVDCFYRTGSGGGLIVRFYNQNRIIVHTSATKLLLVDGRPLQVSVELVQNGADIDYTVAVLAPGDTLGLAGIGTATGLTFGSCYAVYSPPYRSQVVNSAIGHVVVRNSITSIYTLAQQLNAWQGETAWARTKRLCQENSVPVAFISDTMGSSAAMGVQKPDQLTNLIQDCADADMGILADSRSALNLTYRFRNALYNQPPALSLTYQQLLLPFSPTEDDQYLRNDVTVQRVDGSSSQATKATGPLAVTDPTSSSGAGRYDTTVDLNLASDDQTSDAAGWLLNLGTVNEPRYPTVKVNVAPLAATPQIALDALSVDIGHRIAITAVPAGLGYDDISQIARGYTETFDGIEHNIEFTCSPESPYQVMELDGTDASRVDIDDSVLLAAVTSTGTSMTVGSPTNQTWSTTPGDWPIPLKLGGEKVSATAVTNAVLANSTFESGLSPWTSGGTSSFTQSGTQKHSGSFAARVVPDGVSAQGGPVSEQIPIAGGMQVSVGVWVWFTSTVTGTFSCSVNFYDSAGGYLTTSSAFVSVAAVTWTQVSNVFIAPANAAFAAMVPVLIGTPAGSQIWYVDDVTFAGPQKLTVTRSVNSVVKAQPVGTPIGLARPALAAL